MVSHNRRGNLLTPPRQQQIGNQSSSGFVASTEDGTGCLASAVSPDDAANDPEMICQTCTPSNPSDISRGREVLPDSPLTGFVKKGKIISYRTPMLDEHGNTVRDKKGIPRYHSVRKETREVEANFRTYLRELADVPTCVNIHGKALQCKCLHLLRSSSDAVLDAVSNSWCSVSLSKATPKMSATPNSIYSRRVLTAKISILKMDLTPPTRVGIKTRFIYSVLRRILKGGRHSQRGWVSCTEIRKGRLLFRTIYLPLDRCRVARRATPCNYTAIVNHSPGT